MLNRLKNWLRGEANWEAEQELNRMGKKDAFLKDALEGYQAMPEADHVQAISDLKGRLKKQQTITSASRMNWSAMAAGIALIGAVALFFWTQREIPQNEALVQSTNAKDERTTTETLGEKAKQAPVTEISPAREDAIDFVAEETSEPTIDADDNIRRQAVKPATVDPSNIEAGIIEEADLAEFEPQLEQETKVDQVPPIVSDTKEDASIALANENPPPAYPTEGASREGESQSGYAQEEDIAAVEKDKEKNKAADSRIAPGVSKAESPGAFENNLNGKVVDLSSDEGLIGASIYIKETGEGTTTDLYGNFNLQSKTDLPWTVVTSYTGFADQEFVINDSKDSFQIKMDNQGIELSEIVVTGLSVKKRQKSNTSSVSSNSSAESPEPRIGFKKMKRYIRRNLNYPELAKQNNIQGGVTIRFYINEEGTPEQLSVLNSLGSGCDKEAMRLIEEGPEWKPTGVWAIYTVVFSL